MMGEFSGRCMWPLVVALSFLASVAGDQAVVAQELKPSLFPPAVEGGAWRLTWSTEPGGSYRLERSGDLLEWEEVRTISADGTSESVLDPALGGADSLFWRVVRLDGSGGTVVSEIVPAFGPGGGGSVAGLTISIDSDSPVRSVAFFDGETLLGSAQPGLGNDWSFSLPFDPGKPVVRRLSIHVTGRDGEVIMTESAGVLVADPSQFMAGELVVAGAKVNGSEFAPALGQFIAVDENGLLAPFFYFPEGQALSAKFTGAHLAFPEGARLDEVAGDAVLSFQGANFFRGGVDPQPIPSLAGERQMVVGAVTPAAVEAAFDFGANPAQLVWGILPLEWLDGTLSSDGWAAHRVRLPVGDFSLPGIQTVATVTIDPGDGGANLLVCYHGEWSPAPSGPLFRVPGADPLKVYLDTSGGFQAHGSAEAEFPSGAKVSGSLAWRQPNFEFRFEGKGIVIPALGELAAVLPNSPEDCVDALPASPTAAELDLAAACLAGMRDTFRGLALGGISQIDPGQPDTFVPLPSPTDQAGAALSAWAGRIVSWGADRAGAGLGEPLGEELTHVVQQGGKSAAAAHDLPSVLGVLRNLTDIRRRLELVAAGPDRDEVEAALGVALSRALAAASRIIEASPEYGEGGDTAVAVALLTEVIDRLPSIPSPAVSPRREKKDKAGEGELRDQVFRISSGLQARVPLTLFTDAQVEKGNLRQDNPILSQRSLDELFGFLTTVDTIFDLLRQTDRDLAATDAPDEFPILEALLQSQPTLVLRHNDEAARALARQDAALGLKVLRDRARIFALYKKFGITLASDVGLYSPPIAEFIAGFEPILVASLSTLEPDARFDTLTDYITSLGIIGASVSDRSNLGALLMASLQRIGRINDSLASLIAGDPKCDELTQELVARGESVISAPLGYEGQQVPPISGKYESIADSGLSRTLQINSGGRYFMANLQFHNPGTPLTHYRLRGMLASESEDTAEYSYLRIAPSTGQIITSGTMTAAISNGSTVISLRDRSGSISVFVQVSAFPAYSESLVGLFPGEAGALLQAQRDAPLHSRQADVIVTVAEEIKGLIRDSIRPGADSGDQLIAAVALNALIRDTGDALADEHLILFRHIVRIHLSSSKPSDDEGEIDDSALSYHNWLMFLFNQRRDQMPETAEMLGFVPGTIDLQNLFTYEVSVVTSIVAGDLGPVGAGGGVMTVTVNKTTPTGSQTSFTVLGPLGQVGVGPGLKFSTVISNDSFTFNSPFNYLPGDFAGPVSTTGGSATVALGPGVQFSLGAVVMFGSGRLPPVSYQPSIIDGVLGIGVGAGIDQGFGTLVPSELFFAASELHLTGDFSPLSYAATEQALFDTAVDFEVDSALINECGWQNLREFGAEFRAIFASPTAQVLIVGMTDTTGTSSHNLTLSQDRAQSVREALLAVVGPFDVLPDERVVAVGVGEVAADRDVPVSQISNGAVRSLVEFLRLQNATIADSVDDPAWRRVVIIINDLVTTEVGHPKDLIAQ